jgi:hypothetical protein
LVDRWFFTGAFADSAGDDHLIISRLTESGTDSSFTFAFRAYRGVHIVLLWHGAIAFNGSTAILAKSRAAEPDIIHAGFPMFRLLMELE